MKQPLVHTLKYSIASVALWLGVAPHSWAGPPIVEPEPAPVFYIFGYGGANWLEGTDGEINDGLSLDFNTDTGWNAGGGVGWRSLFLGGSRFEIEGYYRENELDDANLNGFSRSSDGDNGSELNSKGVLVNLVKEFPLFASGVIGYAGAGAGWAQVEGEANYGTEQFSDEADVFVWQVIAGLEFPITDRFGLYTEYRLTPFTDFSLEGHTAAGDVSLGFDELYNHGVVAGFRFYF